MDEPRENYDLMEVVMVMMDSESEQEFELLDYVKGVLDCDKEKIIEQVGTLPEKVIKEVDAVSGVGNMILNRGLSQGENLLAGLLSKLTSLGKSEDVTKCIEDPEYREKMYIAYGFKKNQESENKKA